MINLRDLVANKENLRVKDKEARRRSIPYAANHLVRLLRAMFNLAKDWGMVTGDNPAARIKLFPEHKRDFCRRMNWAVSTERLLTSRTNSGVLTSL